MAAYDSLCVEQKCMMAHMAPHSEIDAPGYSGSKSPGWSSFERGGMSEEGLWEELGSERGEPMSEEVRHDEFRFDDGEPESESGEMSVRCESEEGLRRSVRSGEAKDEGLRRSVHIEAEDESEEGLQRSVRSGLDEGRPRRLVQGRGCAESLCWQ